MKVCVSAYWDAHMMIKSLTVHFCILPPVIPFSLMKILRPMEVRYTKLHSFALEPMLLALLACLKIKKGYLRPPLSIQRED
jgi:hypothetical protein